MSPLLVGDHRRLTADTGWEPQIPFEQTVDDLLDMARAGSIELEPRPLHTRDARGPSER